ncbi:hypothetical protein TrVGV298_002828 [Trichoderma virens]|nr:hypothetical protein TrVGV298_002828 [Trichoderma virens]
MNIVNVFSEEAMIEEQIFNKFTTTLEIPLEVRLGISEPHTKLPLAPNSQRLYDILDEIFVHAYRWHHGPNHNFSSIFWDLADMFKKQAHPIYPVSSQPIPETQLEWICKDPTFVQWGKSPGVSILHVCGSDNITDIAPYIFHQLDVSRNRPWRFQGSIYYFKFSRHDVRRDSIGKMATAFVNAICTRKFMAVDQMNGSLGELFPGYWSDEDAWTTFTQLMFRLGQDLMGTFIIDGLDECDDSRIMLISDLLYLAKSSERPVKFVITSTSTFNEDIRRALQDCLTIDLDISQENIMEIKEKDLFELELLDLLFQCRPYLKGSRKDIQGLLESCGVDFQLRRQVLSWLQVSSSVSSISGLVREIHMLSPLTSERLFYRILDTIPLSKLSWAQKIAEWAVNALQPLRKKQIAIVTSLYKESEESIDSVAELENFDIVADIRECFGPILAFENGELHFASPCYRHLLSRHLRNVWKVSDANSHWRIAECCVAYFDIPEVQKHLSQLHGQERISLDPLTGADEFFYYALRFLPAHYDLGLDVSIELEQNYKTTEGSDGDEMVMLKSMALPPALVRFYRNHIDEGYWSAASASSFTCQSFLANYLLLPLDAIHSPGRLRQIQDRDLLMGLHESVMIAASVGERHYILKSLETGLFDQHILKQTLLSAVKFGQNTIASDLIRYVTNSALEGFEWPDMLICRLSWLGKRDLVELCLAAGASADTRYEEEQQVWTQGPLDFAVSKNRIQTIALLLKHIDLKSEYASRLLETALEFGYTETVSMLLDQTELKLENPSLFLAISSGNFIAIRELISSDKWKNVARTVHAYELSSAAGYGYTKCVEALLHYRAYFNIDAALRKAAQNGHIGTCRLLIDNGARVETELNKMIIMGAIGSGRVESLQLMVDRGAIIDADIQNTALTLASKSECWDTVRYLVEKSADVPMKPGDSFEGTPLYYAIINGSAEIARLLIDAGTSLTPISGAEKMTYLHLALASPAMIKVLLEQSAHLESESIWGTPLYLASRSNYLESIHEILKFSPNIEYVLNNKDSAENGYTPLRIAISRGNIQAARLLLDAGVNVNAQIQRDRTTPLHAAMGIGSEDMIALLLEYNVKTELPDSQGRTPLLLVNTKTSVSMVKRIVNRGGDIEVRDKHTFTPLCVAVREYNHAVTEYLIKRGAHLAVSVTGYGSPLHIACRYADLKMVKLLVEGGADVNFTHPDLLGTPLMTTCLYLRKDTDEGKKKIMSYLLDDGRTDINIVTGAFGTILSIACIRCEPEIIHLLLTKKANISATDDIGRQPIHFAALSTAEHLALLIKSGADIFAKDKIGRSCIHYAASSGRVDLVEKILDYMEDAINEEDNNGWTPLLWATRSCGQEKSETDGCFNVINILLERGANLFVRGEGYASSWTPAEYHAFGWKRGIEWDGNKFCSACLLEIRGEGHICETCQDFALCFKCFFP